MTGFAKRAAGILALLCLPAAAGCERSRLEREGRRAVEAYDRALVVAYRTNDPRGLEQVAGSEEVRRLIALLDLKRSADLVLESELEAFAVEGVEPAGPEALLVRTRERWRYWDRPLKPGRPAGTIYVADMTMEWHLERQGESWKVKSGRTLRSDYLEPKGFRPQRGEPAADGEQAAGAAPAARREPGT